MNSPVYRKFNEINGLPDYYQWLEVDPHASMADIKKQYNKLLLTYHPDKWDDPKATKYAKKFIAANQILSNRTKRNSYDEAREEALASQRPEAMPNNPHFPQEEEGELSPLVGLLQQVNAHLVVQKENGLEILHLAENHYWDACLLFIQEHQLSFIETDLYGHNIMTYALQIKDHNFRYGVIERILNWGPRAAKIKINSIDYPLHIAISYRDERLVELLLNRGANVSSMGRNGTALHELIQDSELYQQNRKLFGLMLTLLIAHRHRGHLLRNDDLDVQYRGQTPFDLAIQNHQGATARLLMRARDQTEQPNCSLM